MKEKWKRLTHDLKRRVVSQISEYLEPRQIFALITEQEWAYSPNLQKAYACRDRGMMSCVYCSGGRISPVVGGDRFQRIEGKAVKVGKYEGLKWDNLTFSKEGYILIKGMQVAKRSQKLVAKYGAHIQVRDDFVIPLTRGLFENPYWDQLVPFSWLIIEYLKNYRPKTETLFPYERKRAWAIIRQVTGKYPNWFRAQAEHFYGHFLLRDSVKLAKFVKVVRPEQVAHYIGHSWRDQMKHKESDIDFEWIDRETSKIKARLK